MNENNIVNGFLITCGEFDSLNVILIRTRAQRTDGRLELLNSRNKRLWLFHLAKAGVRLCFIAPAILYFTMAIHHGRSCKSQIRRDIVKFYGLPDPGTVHISF